MSDNGSPFVVWMPGVLTLFGQTLAGLRVRHLRTQINSPWTNGKIERVWGTLQAEVLDRQLLTTPEAADLALSGWAGYYNYHPCTARSAGGRPPSASTGRPSPIADSSSSPRWSTCRAGLRS